MLASKEDYELRASPTYTHSCSNDVSSESWRGSSFEFAAVDEALEVTRKFQQAVERQWVGSLVGCQEKHTLYPELWVQPSWVYARSMLQGCNP